MQHTTQQPAYWLLVHQFSLGLNDSFQIPFGQADELNFAIREAITIGEKNGYPVKLVLANDSDPIDRFTNLRATIALPESERNLLQRAVSLAHFLQTHRHCGRCGHITQLADQEIALHCTHCAAHFYPTISPCVIVAIHRGREILLANHQRHKGTIYTCLAGFVETGESIEQAVEREVFEESGLKIKNLRYHGSQPWAFPNSLMFGFLADYDSGDIQLQDSEIYDARWFDCDQPLPELPPKGTIALELIEKTLELCRKS